MITEERELLAKLEELSHKHYKDQWLENGMVQRVSFNNGEAKEGDAFIEINEKSQSVKGISFFLDAIQALEDVCVSQNYDEIAILLTVVRASIISRRMTHFWLRNIHYLIPNTGNEKDKMDMVRMIDSSIQNYLTIEEARNEQEKQRREKEAN